MIKEDKILIDAIGSVLDRHEIPVPISELLSMLNGGYLDYIGKDLVEKVTEDDVDQCVKQNSELFDNYFGVISLKNQKLNSIDEIEKELKKYLNKNSDVRILDFILSYLLFIRYAAVQDHFALKNLSTGQLTFRTYSEPERLNCRVVTKLIKQFTALYGDESCNVDFRFDNEELINQRLEDLAKIVRRIDWRVHKFSIQLFDELIVNLQKLNRFKRNRALIPDKLSEFIQSLLDGQNVDKITEIHSCFADFIPFPLSEEKVNKEIEIDSDEKLRSIQSGLRVALKGYSNVRINCSVISNQQKEDSDIVISFPPSGKLPKSFWAENFADTDIEIRSLEELYTRLAIRRLNANGKAYFILPDNFLSSNQNSLLNLRKEIIKNGWLDTIVKIPQYWMLPHIQVSLNIVILNLQGVDSTYYFDMTEFDRHCQSENKDFTNSASELIREKASVQNISRSVELSSMLESKSDLSVNKHISPIHFPEVHERSDSEKLIKLGDLVNVIRSKREKVTQEHPFVNMTELSDEPSNYVIDFKSLPKKRNYSNNRPLLNEDALLVGTVGGVLKPTLFQYNTNPIFLGSNVYPLRIDTPEIDPEYLIFELNTEFVKNQVRKFTKGATIPHINRSDLLNIVIRVPESQEQSRLFNEWISSIAKDKIKEIENLHESIKYIEKDVFSSFAHDFGKLQLKVSSSIDVIEAYLENLARKEIISLEESVFGEENSDEGERVKDVIHRLRESHHRSIEFLKSEVRSLTQDLQANKTIQLGELIEKWCISQNTDHFNFELTEGSYGNNSNELISSRTFENGYLIKGNEADIYKILDNLLDNAIKHGFGPNKHENKFRIHLENWITDEKNLVIVNMSVGNTGRPFPADFSCEDFFKRRHRGPESKGEGLGGYSIKRAIDNLNAFIDCETKALSKKEYPVQFNIEFEPYDNDEQTN